jgi:hypothetical protein
MRQPAGTRYRDRLRSASVDGREYVGEHHRLRYVVGITSDSAFICDTRLSHMNAEAPLTSWRASGA